MNRPEFERQLARLRDRIAELPAGQRDALEALVSETVARHEQIHRASLEGHRAAERLELAFERLGEACRNLVALARQAHEAAGRARTAPQPGLN